MSHLSDEAALNNELRRDKTQLPNRHFEVVAPKPTTLGHLFTVFGFDDKVATEVNSSRPPLANELSGSLQRSLSLASQPVEPSPTSQPSPHHLVYPSTRQQFDFFHKGDPAGNEQEKHVLYELLSKNGDTSYRSVAISSHVWYDSTTSSVKENDIVLVHDAGVLILEIKGLKSDSDQVVDHVIKALHQGAGAVKVLNDSLFHFINNSEENKQKWGQISRQPVPIHYPAVLPRADVEKLQEADQLKLEVHLQSNDPYHIASKLQCATAETFSTWLRGAVFRGRDSSHWSSARWSVLQEWAEVMLCRTRLIMKKLVDEQWDAIDVRLTAHQAALSQSSDRETRIRGYAGTGKTVIALAKIKNQLLSISDGKYPHQVFFFTSQPAFRSEECFNHQNVHFYSPADFRTSPEEYISEIHSAIQQGAAANQRQHMIVDEYQIGTRVGCGGICSRFGACLCRRRRTSKTPSLSSWTTISATSGRPRSRRKQASGLSIYR